MSRSEIINKFIKKYSLYSYLEIGTRNKVDNFNRIKAKEKLCIDPDTNANADLILTSDEFFKICNKKFDIIFIDGMHEAHQVYKDINNSINHLNKNGVIVCHDCMPLTNEAQKDYELYEGWEQWNGDSWKGFAKYRQLSNYLCYVIKEDEGCGIIDTNILSDLNQENRLVLNINELTFQTYIENQQLMNFKDTIV